MASYTFRGENRTKKRKDRVNSMKLNKEPEKNKGAQHAESDAPKKNQMCA